MEAVNRREGKNMDIQIIKTSNSVGTIYDVFVDGSWELSRTSPDNIFTWLAEKTRENTIKLDYVER